jgi:hypothetical protein
MLTTKFGTFKIAVECVSFEAGLLLGTIGGTALASLIAVFVFSVWH